MGTFIMLGKYTLESVAKISPERTDDAKALVEKHGGKFTAGYALLGEYDLIMIADFPSKEEAMRTSVALSKMLGIGFTTFPTVPFETFDKLTADL